MAKTVKEHTTETNSLIKHLEQGDALVIKLKRELEESRKRFEWLEEFSHPNFEKKWGRAKDGRPISLSMKKSIQSSVESINAILGDRA